ncbi:glycosyl transferase family 90-domain-containing protein [Mycena galopus ATCC 62051]|nr:glycosyl transferase family 90-domain-containing protein [Mycena galopus ATCC 62051]
MSASYFVRTRLRGESSSQLPSGHWRKEYAGDNSYGADLVNHRSTSRRWMPFVGLTLLGMVVFYIPLSRKWRDSPVYATPDIFPDVTFEMVPPNFTEVIGPLPDFQTSTPETIARQSIVELFKRQSRTLEQASAQYTLKSGLAPPPNYDKWFQFAQEKRCLIDDYDRIHRDFEPFHQLAQDHPNHFHQMVEAGRNMTLQDPRGMTMIRVHRGEVQLPQFQGTSFDGNLQSILEQFARVLPDMDILINGRDEPRVLFNVRAAGAQGAAVRLKDLDPFRIAPVPTSDFFRKQAGCDFSSTPTGFVSDPINDIAFLRSSSSSDFTTDLWPLLSMTKISCFSDILFPGVYYYESTWWSGKFAYPNDIPWEDKSPMLYWRGMSNGGHIRGQNYRDFPRFRLIKLARNHSDLIDARMTTFAETHCTENCDREGIIKEYGIEGPSASREEVYRFKYLLDIDGNTFSGRYLGLLRSGSLVFKSTAFEEYFSDWMRPYEHYIPVRPDLSDLVEKVEWARQNDAEARIIQARGMQFAQRVMTDSQNDCYLSLVLLEWARLQNSVAGSIMME